MSGAIASEQEAKEWDFIVVGAGPAGAAIASKLAHSPSEPTVLLVEAGSDQNNNDASIRMLGSKALSHTQAGRAWGYVAAPNPHLDGRSLALVRGKGTGGGSAINFGAWTEGAAQDWDRMARLMGDDAWKWENVKKRFNELTTHHCTSADVRPEYQRYIRHTPGNYGTSGPLHIGYPDKIEDELLELIHRLENFGIPYRPEANNGTLDGLIYHPESFWRGVRSISTDILPDGRENLQIVLDTQIRRVLLEHGQAVGVEAVDGRVFKASKEVILSASTTDSPKILMLSGIGPADQLSRCGIPIVHANPNVGRNFQDHFTGLLSWRDNEEFTQRPAFFRSRDAQKRAFKEWELHRTGPYASMGSAIFSLHGIDETRHSAEFAALPDDIKAFLTQPNVPFYEFIWGFCTYPWQPDPDNISPSFDIFVSLQYPQSRGSFSLQSADPNVPLLFQTDFLSHPFDKRQAVEATRKALAIMSSDAMSNRVFGPSNLPASDSEEDILAWWRLNGQSSYHGCSTCKMGVREVEDQAVVDPDFKVFGVRGLRVSDNTIWPHLPALHTQAHAYQAGMVVAEKIIAEHGLAKVRNGMWGEGW